MPSLILKFRDKILSAHPLKNEGGVTIGRHQSNDIVIDNLAVSGYHARVDLRPEGFLITDLESKNGTFLNEQQVSSTVLNDQDSIHIGKHVLLVDLTDSIDVDGPLDENSGGVQAPASLAREKTMVLETSHGRQASSEEPPPEKFHPAEDTLLFLAGGEGEINLTGKNALSIGRNKDADIVVGGLWALLIGGPAAMINKRTGAYFLRYTGGLVKPKRNGSSVRGTVKLNHEDIVSVGPVQVQIHLSERPAA